ncbi:hypothetical protein PG995_004090 [Apiospora arundinis]
MNQNTTNYSCTPGQFAGHQFKYSAGSLNATIGYVSYTPQLNKPLSDLPEWKALAACCADARNVTKLEGDCELWCSLSPARFPPSADDKTILKDLSQCLATNKDTPFSNGAGFAKPQEYTVVKGPSPTPSTTSSGGPSSKPTDGGAAGTQKPGPNAGSSLGMPSLTSAGLLVLALGAFQMAV